MKFGTDGLRGAANVELTPELALALGRAAARVVGGGRWVTGRDTRRSGLMLEEAFCAGLLSEGIDVMSLGIAPTPEVAWWAAREGLPAAMVSASHNPFTDNGIKLFAAGGKKLPGDVERHIEGELTTMLARPLAELGPVSSEPGDVGRFRHFDGRKPYARALLGSIEARGLEPLKLVVDCANGAAASIAPAVFPALTDDVEVINDEPDGENINHECGSTHPGRLQEAVPASGADAGIAFDGDADRVVLVDATGRLIDGDQIIAILARDLAERGELTHNTVVVTVMTNLGFRLAMAETGIDVVETAVGDRYVLEALDEGGFALGGEQSGHVILRQLATTGDGLLTAVQALDVVVRSGQTLADLASAAMTRLPQVLRNVRVSERDPAIVERIRDEVAAVEKELGDRGRVLVRPSGTEPLIRVMVEAPDESVAEAAAERLASAVTAAGSGGT